LFKLLKSCKSTLSLNPFQMYSCEAESALWLKWVRVCRVVGRPEFDSLAELDQKTLKVGIHSFPAWHSAFKMVSVEIDWQVHLLCPWASHLMELPLLLMVRLVVTAVAA